VSLESPKGTWLLWELEVVSLPPPPQSNDITGPAWQHWFYLLSAFTKQLNATLQQTQGAHGATPIFFGGDSDGDGEMGSPGAPGKPGRDGPAGPAGIGIDGEDGVDGFPVPGPAGTPGTPGTPGTTGASGPVGPAFFWQGDPGEDGWPIPGNQGIQGVTGNPGVSGQPGFSIDGEDGQDGMAVPGVPGPQGTPGANGTNGTNGANGLAGPAIFLTADDGEEGQPGPVVPLPTDVVKSDATCTLAVGYSCTPYNAGTKTTGTFTPDPANGGQQYCTNGGAFTLAPPSSKTSMILEVLNNGSAGAVTTSGFTKVVGTFDTTNGHKFACMILTTQSYSLLQIQALQ
jgi:hypothetical protein